MVKMVLLSFSCEKKKKTLLNKECSQTIRPIRKNPIKVGDKLQIYWKVRKAKDKKDVHKIGEGIVRTIASLEFGRWDVGYAPIRIKRFGKNSRLSTDDENFIAKQDGFGNRTEMFNWFWDKYGNEIFKQTFKVMRWEWKEVK